MVELVIAGLRLHHAESAAGSPYGGRLS
jgi:hypothetical protein